MESLLVISLPDSGHRRAAESTVVQRRGIISATARGNWCVKGARKWDPAAIQGQIDTFESAPGAVLRECSFPDLLERPEIPIPTAPERELPLANPVGKLDAG
jgi:hypothetical protein